MERITKRRAALLLLFFVIIIGFFASYLYDLQIIQTGGNTDNTTTFTIMTRVKAARGDILDTNGNVLVSNRASYDLAINHYVIKSATGTSADAFRPMTPSAIQSTASPLPKARIMQPIVLIVNGTQRIIAGSSVSMAYGVNWK